MCEDGGTQKSCLTWIITSMLTVKKWNKIRKRKPHRHEGHRNSYLHLGTLANLLNNKFAVNCEMTSNTKITK